MTLIFSLRTDRSDMDTSDVFIASINNIHFEIDHDKERNETFLKILVMNGKRGVANLEIECKDVSSAQRAAYFLLPTIQACIDEKLF